MKALLLSYKLIKSWGGINPKSRPIYLSTMPASVRGYPQPYGYLWKTPEKL
jgi:hypothetical protein